VHHVAQESVDKADVEVVVTAGATAGDGDNDGEDGTNANEG
jgi:hypothetical protein